jgi:ParB-like chromosome segregation protein Spo0J
MARMRTRTKPKARAKPFDNGHAAADPEIVWHGPEALRPLLVPIAELHEDPANLNIHDEPSLAGIAASYARFGQQKTIAHRGKVVRAGNGQLIAARRLGWTHIAAVESDLDGADLVAYGIADNQTARPAHLDEANLPRVLAELKEHDPDLTQALGFSHEELTRLLASAQDETEQEQQDDGQDDDSGKLLVERWMVVIECANEQQQVELLNRFQEEGLTCRAIVA